MGQSFYQQVQMVMSAMQAQMQQMDNQIISLTTVLKEIVGKELMRNQALHKVLMDKKMFTDEELKVALETIISEAQADLKAQAEKVAEEKAKAVEILVPAGHKPLEATAPDAAPVTEAPKE